MIAYPLRVRSSSVLRQIHGVNEDPQRAGNVGFSAWKVDDNDGVLEIFNRVVAIEMKLDGRTITEDHNSDARLVSPDLQQPDYISDEVSDHGKSVHNIIVLPVSSLLHVKYTLSYRIVSSSSSSFILLKQNMSCQSS